MNLETLAEAWELILLEGSLHKDGRFVSPWAVAAGTLLLGTILVLMVY